MDHDATNRSSEIDMATADPTLRSNRGEPTWEIAHLFPKQGTWSAADYLSLNTNHLVEFSDGTLEVLPMPTELHQLIVGFLYDVLKAFVVGKLGKVLFAPLRVQLWEGKFREPDLVFLLAENANLRGDRFWRGADLVMEVVSEDDPERDLLEKRKEYAKAGIREYWIVDPRDSTITVLTLADFHTNYTSAGTYAMGDVAKSALLAGFEVNVRDVFEQS